MDVEDQTGCPNQQITDGMVTNYSPGNVSAAFETIAIQPKVRKPYTIIKQRERWTEEEHQKFLEALKLYGRAWRQIEEHVGTKTAVQIRSHAQKFFSKVVRDSSGSAEGSLKPTEIPPPRPKKKPMHPYPRKMADSLPTKITVPPQRERCPSPNKSIGEVDNLSPTSVLSAVGSDTLGSAVSEVHNSCLSPLDSCTNGTSLLTAKEENGYIISYSSAEEVKASASSLRANVAPSLDDKSTQKLELLSKNTSSPKETAATETPSMSIKLFGKTVLVMDSQKSSFPHAESYMPAPSETSQENFEKDENPIEALSMNHIQSQLSTQMVYSHGSPWPFGGPLPPKESLKVDYNSVEAIPDNMPWLALYQGLLFPYLQSYSQTKVESSLDERVIEDKVRRERSCSSSNTGSISEVDNGHNNFDAIESRHQQANVERIGYAKGFVPYKRCLTERDVNSSMIVQEEREGQRARVCS